MRRHFKATAARCGWGDTAEDIVGELLAKMEGAIDTVATQLPQGFPEDVATAVFEGMRAQARRLHEQPADWFAGRAPAMLQERPGHRLHRRRKRVDSATPNGALADEVCIMSPMPQLRGTHA